MATREPREPTTTIRRVVFVHSSNEMFGADRILLQVVRSLLLVPGLMAEVWLPSDVEEGRESIRQELQAIGVKVLVLPLPILRRRELKVRRLPGLLARTLRLWVLLRRSGASVVYCATSAALVAAPVARLAGVHTVILHNQEIWSGREARVLGLLGAFCTHAVAISESARRSLVGTVARRAVTIHNAVPDCPMPKPLPIDIVDGELKFLIASRWNSWKGHETLLRAWNSLPEAPGHLTVVGSPPDVGLAVDVVGLVSKLRHPDSVTVVGQVADIIPYLDACDFMIVPSDDPEPFGLVAIEAFSRYRPVIGSNAGGLAEVVSDGKTGLLFPPRDSVALARVLSSVSRTSAAGQGLTARHEFEQYYSLETYLTEFSAYWRRISAAVPR